jgi:uncharacterized RDD family membrane protein YckC
MAAVDAGTRGIVTPEAVLLEFEPARLGTRTLGLGVDLAIQFAALLAVLFALGAVSAATDVSSTVGIILVTILVFLIILGYPALTETFLGGRTVGMMAVGLRVVTKEGAPERFRHAAIRSALMLVDFWLAFGGIGAITMLCTQDSQRLGDLAAGTLVLRERSGAMAAQPITFMPPPGWEPYAASLDPGQVNEEQYGLVRSFLLRVHELSPGARHHLSVKLADGMARTMRHQAPPGVHPEPFLICVAAAYQRLHSGGNPAWGPNGPMGAYAPVPAAGTWGQPAPGQPPVQGQPSPGAVHPDWTEPSRRPGAEPVWEGPPEEAAFPEPDPKPFGS